mmetsp:Transcript_14483/g.36936  ORF Transcript_14483/g.36936 Transcript_14483/m.36936 type:complete len:620 (-) Transcript_14483:75-1934(-)
MDDALMPNEPSRLVMNLSLESSLSEVWRSPQRTPLFVPFSSNSVRLRWLLFSVDEIMTVLEVSVLLNSATKRTISKCWIVSSNWMVERSRFNVQKPRRIGTKLLLLLTIRLSIRAGVVVHQCVVVMLDRLHVVQIMDHPLVVVVENEAFEVALAEVQSTPMVRGLMAIVVSPTGPAVATGTEVVLPVAKATAMPTTVPVVACLAMVVVEEVAAAVHVVHWTRRIGAHPFPTAMKLLPTRERPMERPPATVLQRLVAVATVLRPLVAVATVVGLRLPVVATVLVRHLLSTLTRRVVIHVPSVDRALRQAADTLMLRCQMCRHPMAALAELRRAATDAMAALQQDQCHATLPGRTLLRTVLTRTVLVTWAQRLVIRCRRPEDHAPARVALALPVNRLRADRIRTPMETLCPRRIIRTAAATIRLRLATVRCQTPALDTTARRQVDTVQSHSPVEATVATVAPLSPVAPTATVRPHAPAKLLVVTVLPHGRRDLVAMLAATVPPLGMVALRSLYLVAMEPRHELRVAATVLLSSLRRPAATVPLSSPRLLAAMLPVATVLRHSPRVDTMLQCKQLAMDRGQNRSVDRRPATGQSPQVQVALGIRHHNIARTGDPATMGVDVI